MLLSSRAAVAAVVAAGSGVRCEALLCIVSGSQGGAQRIISSSSSASTPRDLTSPMAGDMQDMCQAPRTAFVAPLGQTGAAGQLEEVRRMRTRKESPYRQCRGGRLSKTTLTHHARCRSHGMCSNYDSPHSTNTLRDLQSAMRGLLGPEVEAPVLNSWVVRSPSPLRSNLPGHFQRASGGLETVSPQAGRNA